jgi:hypothetical protein
MNEGASGGRSGALFQSAWCVDSAKKSLEHSIGGGENERDQEGKLAGSIFDKDHLVENSPFHEFDCCKNCSKSKHNLRKSWRYY